MLPNLEHKRDHRIEAAEVVGLGRAGRLVSLPRGAPVPGGIPVTGARAGRRRERGGEGSDEWGKWAAAGRGIAAKGDTLEGYPIQAGTDHAVHGTREHDRGPVHNPETVTEL